MAPVCELLAEAICFRGGVEDESTEEGEEARSMTESAEEDGEDMLLATLGELLTLVRSEGREGVDESCWSTTWRG